MGGSNKSQTLTPDILMSVYTNAFAKMDQGFFLLEKVEDRTDGCPDFRYVLVNQAFETHTGLIDVTGKTILEVLPGTEPSIMKAYDHVALTGDSVQFQAYVDALNMWMHADVFRVNQTPTQIGVLFTNITDRKEREQKQEFLLKLSDAIRPLADAKEIQSVAIQILGEQLKVDRVLYAEIEPDDTHFVIAANYVTDNFPQMIGRFRLSDFGNTPDSQRMGKTLVLPDITQVQESDEHLRSYLAAGVVSIIGIPLRKDGRWVASLTIHHGRPRQWTRQEVEMVENTAERTWAALQRARAEKNLGEANRQKDEFIAMLGHELRNPLAVLSNTLTYLDLSQGQGSNMSYPAGVQLMNRHVKHLGRMVDDLLDLSRINQGKIELKKQKVDFVEIVRESADAVAATYRSQEKELILDLPEKPLYLRGDSTRLMQVVTNLLTNGARYTGSGGKVWINLKDKVSQQNEMQAILEVRDNGIGLEKDQLSAIFDLFVQVDNSLARSKGGLGLGLALVKKLVEMHEGKVIAESEGLNRGSLFTITLPALENAGNSTLFAATQSDGTGSLRVLIVDDNEDAGYIMSSLLSLKGFHVDTRKNGHGGVEAARTLNPAAIILDIGMPGMDGYETCRQIRLLPNGQSFKIFALSGYGQNSDILKSQQAGFDAHFIKPIDLNEILLALQKSN